MKLLKVRIPGLLAFLLLAACGGGGGGSSTGIAPNTGTVPDMPTGVATTVEPNAINVHFNSVSGATGYNVYYADASGVTEASSTVSGTTSPVTVAGLARGTTYFVRLSAVNSAGESSLTPEQQARTTAPPDPVQTVTANSADGGVMVAWNAVSDATAYTVFASTTAGNVANAVSVNTQLLQASLDGLTNGMTYFVSVRAENIEGSAARSAEIEVTPQPGAGGVGWSAQTLINTPYDFFGRDNYLGGAAINDAGVAAAVWIFSGQTDGNNFVIANLETNTVWRDETILTQGDNSMPRVAVMPNGTIVVVWIRHYLDSNSFRTGSTVESRRFVNNAWTDVETIANIPQGSGTHAGAVELAADGENNVIAAWWQDQNTLWVNRLTATGWDTPMLVSTSVRGLGPPAVGANGTNQGIVAWLQDTEPYDSSQTAGGPSRRSLHAIEFDGTTWGTATRVGHMDLQDFDGAERVNIDVNPAGSAVVVWNQSRDNSADDGFRIDGIRFDATTRIWSAPETIVAKDWQVSWPDVAIDAFGGAVATFQPTDLADSSSTRVLEAAMFDPASTTWGAAAPVNQDDGVTEPSPMKVEMDANSDVFALWKQTDGVYWRRFDATSQSWAAIARLGTQGGPNMAFAMSANGHAVVVTNPLIVNNSSFEHAVYAISYRP